MELRPGGSSVESSKGDRRSLSERGLARELARLSPSSLSPVAFSEKTLMVPNIQDAERELQRLVGVCDRAYRTAPRRETPGADWPATWSREGSQMRRGPEFDAACACYRPSESWCRPPSNFFAPPIAPNAMFDGQFGEIPLSIEESDDAFTFDFNAFTAAAVRCKHVPDDAYGIAGDVIRLKATAISRFNNAASITRGITGELLRRANVLVGERNVHSEHAGTDLITAYMETTESASSVAAMWQRIEGRANTLGSAWSTVRMLQARVEKHIADRVARDKHYIEEMSDDTLSAMARHLSPSSASSLMRTSRAFAGIQTLRDRLPHIRIRHVVGAFPHGRVISRDRVDLAHGLNKPVMRAFVVKRNAVRLYVDFIVNVLRPRPLKKLPRKDGLCNRDHDFPDDEYEQAPERAEDRGPQASHLYTDNVLRQAALDKRHREAWEAGEGPPEPVDRFSYDRRLAYTTYFRAPLSMTPSLVFADDHSAVPCAEHKGALAVPTTMRARGGSFSQPRQRDVFYTFDHTHPASVKLHVPHLSRDHCDRLFKIKVVADGTLKDGTAYQCTIFSESFESVGRREAVGNAGKRGAVADTMAKKPKTQHR